MKKTTGESINTDVFNKSSPIPKLQYTPYQIFDKDKAIIRIHVNSINNIISSIRSDLSNGISTDDKEMAINLLTMARQILTKSDSHNYTENEEAPAKYRRYVCLMNKIDDGVTEYKWHLIDYANNLSYSDLGPQCNGFVYMPNGLPVPSAETTNKIYIVDNKLMESK